ncbi:hypothetical protein SAMN05192575_101892 [Nocardioides alpinus]|uniref:Uncharacterized protein n=1 Tax=Nocardioides alpinus TaxID=748909 RepID=A0A1I0WD50_9ACTN|nr:hypothetical protein [Nocardioides alpinus]PKH37837.1 hypothetical protein CXG46_20805 [Nocardioides alpinus]SFA86327.1 hypothetical protein SAMN05192575_101892 [Nocardioides alpinus]
MSDATDVTSTSVRVDERARFRAFTALALALTALAGGGIIASALQWLVLDNYEAGPSDAIYLMTLGGAPLLLSIVACYLASTAMSSADLLARPLARASLVLSGLAILGAAVLVFATAGTS